MSPRNPRRVSPAVVSLLICALLAPAVYALTPDGRVAATATAAAATSQNQTNQNQTNQNAASPNAASPNAASENATNRKKTPRPLMWKVSDGDNKLYLLGSFHLLKTDDYPLSSDIDLAFDDAEQVIFEVPPAELNDPVMLQQKMLGVAGYGDGRKLSSVLPADVREKLDRLLGVGGHSSAQFDAFEPWFVNLSLVLGTSQLLGFQADQGLDQHLMKRAAQAGKPTNGLESLDQQLQAMDSTPMAEQIAGLQDFLDHRAEVPRMFQDMHEAWRDGDVERLSVLTIDEMRGKLPESYRLLDVERNNAWIPQLQKLLDESKKDDALVVVGAMHLLGSDGVVEQLRAKGYTIERICSDCAP